MTIAALRADGDAKTGLGHIVRAIALGEALGQMGHEPVLVTRRNGPVREFVAARSRLRIVELRDDEDDVEKILSIAAGLVVLDIQSTAHKLVSAIKEAGCFIVTFDDLGDGRYLADLVVDANLTESTNPSKLTTTTRYLLGPRYAVIGGECLKMRKKLRRFDRIRRILISCGGSDPAGATARIVRALGALDSEIDVDVIVGPAFQHGKELSKAILSSPRHFTMVDSPNDLPRRMKGADLGILSAGVTLAEAACLGLPSIVIAQDPVQARNVSPYVECDGVCYLGVAGDDVFAALPGAVRDLAASERRRAMSRALTAQVDGRGLARIQEEIRGIIST